LLAVCALIYILWTEGNVSGYGNFVSIYTERDRGLTAFAKE